MLQCSYAKSALPQFEFVSIWNIVNVQEYHIRKMDGHTLDEEAKSKVKKCLEAAIERRSSEVRVDEVLVVSFCGICITG